MGRVSLLVALTFTSLSSLVPNAAFAQARLTQPELRRWVRAVLDQNEPMNVPPEAEPLDPPAPEFPARYSIPRIDLEADAVYYDFGFVELADVYYELGQSGDPSETYVDMAEEAPIAAPGEETEAPAEEAPLPHSRRDPFYFPTRGQFLVEVIRKFRDSPSARQAWAPHLARAETVIAKELEILYAGGGGGPSIPLSQETVEALWDCDEMVQRIVMGYLDALALSRRQVVRRHEKVFQGVPLFSHHVQLAPQPRQAELYYLPQWDFRRLEYLPGAVGHLKHWKPAPADGVSIAGGARFLGIWRTGGEMRSSGFVYRNVTQDEVLPLAPTEPWPPRTVR